MFRSLVRRYKASFILAPVTATVIAVLTFDEWWPVVRGWMW